MLILKILIYNFKIKENFIDDFYFFSLKRSFMIILKNPKHANHGSNHDLSRENESTAQIG